MQTTLQKNTIDSLLHELASINAETMRHYPGEPHGRQAVHTVYGGAHLFKSDTTKKLGVFALNAFQEYAPSPEILGQAFGLNLSNPGFIQTLHTRVKEKLTREAVEDFRIDFEDGFGSRSDEEEDKTAIAASTELAQGMKTQSISPFIGIRVKTLSEELKHRALRTVDLFISNLVKQAGKLPSDFVITLPKITSTGQITVFVKALQALEQELKLPTNTLKIEFMIETTQSLFDPHGHQTMMRFLEAARGRCVAAHFGTYDYTASCNITAPYQAMDHQACNFARDLMKIAYASSGIMLSDGATNVMPVPPHKNPNSERERQENRSVVHAAWKLAYDHTRHSLKNGFYQGWDLHPAQFVARYVAVYAFFLEGLAPVSTRLKNFVDKAAQATLVGDVFDDAATGQGLLNYFLRAWNCGAIAEQELMDTGLTMDEIRTRSFVQIMKRRRK